MDEPQGKSTDKRNTPTMGQPDYVDASSPEHFVSFLKHHTYHNSVRKKSKNYSFIDDTVNSVLSKPFENLSLDVLWERLNTIDKLLQEEFDSTIEQEVYLKIKQEILRRIAILTQQETKRNITSLRVLAEKSDVTIREKMLVELAELEENAKQNTDLEIEQRRTQIQLDAEERRAKTRFQYLDRLLERESAATLLGGFLLLLITIALLIGMIWQEPAREIVYNGFLILLGYFFGQTAGKAIGNRNSTP